jgi:F420-non-reducing hydrogenase iron-sulfur subunit
MYFLSSAEGVRFAEIATEMTERARALGPNPLKNGSSGDNTDLAREGEHVIGD